MLTFTIVLNFLLVFIKLINGYNICPPIELRSSLTPKQTKSDYLNPSIKTTITTTTTSSSLSSLTSSSVLYLPSSSTTTTSDGSNESSSSPKIVCDCTTETRESAPSWEILCYQEYTLNSPEPDYRSESTVEPETVQYSALPIAFIIKYVISRYIEINCYDSSPEFQPAMFQGFGVNEIDSFRVINCSLPTVPFNLIFHRTSIGSSKDSASSSSSTSKQQTQSSRGGGSTGNGSSQLDSGGTTSSNKVKGIRSLELRRATPIKVDVKQLKHLFHGLDRLEQLTLENHIISITTSERLISNRGDGTVGGEGRRYGRRFKRSFGTRLNSSESSEFGSKLVANEKKVTINPIVGTSSFYSSSSADFDPSTGFTFSTTMKTTAPSLSKLITTKAPTTLSAATAAQITTPSPTIIPEAVAMTTKKPTSIQLSKIPDNNKYYTLKEVDEINLNSHIESPDKKIEEKPVDDSIRKSSSLSPLSSFSSTTVAGLLETKPSLPVASETDDLNADKSTLIPGITVNRQESQSSYQFLSNPIDFSFGSYFPMLKTLVLNNFLVTKSSDSALILKNLLSNLNNLEQLDLRSNILTHIPENLFSGSGRKIKRLYLMRNSIESLHPFAFANLKELEVLDLFSNKIQLLPDSLLKDTNKLKQFRIKSNNFITLPLNLFASTPLLTSLDLSSNRELSLLPVDLLKGLHQLRDLTINDCNLNKFTINPAKFFSYAFNLEKIELKGNLLTNLTQFHLFAGNPKLSTLDVSNNRIKEIDAEIFNENSSSLVNLNLAKNDLSFIPDKFLYHLKNLRTLNIGNNNLHTINNNIFYTLSNLEVLDLSRNQLISVNPGESKIPFGLGAYLKKINLSHNNLTNFNREFNSIQWNLHLEIEEINLSANKLQGQVKIPIFYSTKSKIILDLRDNQIESVNMDAILINEKLFIEILDTNKAYADGADSSEVKVLISGNPFHCDCNLFPLLKYTRSSTSAKYENLVEKVSFDVSSDKLKCSSPASLSGKSFYEISTSDLTCPLLQTKVCPSSCDCWFRAHDERILIDCQSRNLSSIPKETVNIANYQSLNLPGIKPGTPIKAVTLKMQNNRIKNLQPLERLVSPTHLLSKDVPSTTTISTSASSVGRKKVSTSTILFELYFDNNSIDAIPSSLIKLLKLSTHSINDVNQENSVSESDKDKDIPDTSQSPSSGKPLKHQSSFVTILSALSSSPTKAAIVSLVSLRNNNIHTIPAEFIEDLRELQLAVADNQSISHTGSSNPDANTNNVGSSSIALPKFLKLYLGNNPYNCTPEETSASGEKLFCQMREFKSWLTGNYRIVGDIADINCDSLDYNSNSALINIPDTILCPQLAQLDQTVLLTMTAICISLALCLLLVSILYYRNKQTVLAFFYIHLNPIFVCLHFHEDDLDDDKLYDAFVSYSSADRDIVMQLIEKLEEPSSISNTSICYLQSQSGLPSIHEGHYDQIVPDVGHDIKSVDKSYVSSNIFGNKGLNDSDRNRTSAANHLRATSGGLNGNSHFSDESTMEPDQTQYFKLCIHERDWLPGNLISWNIVNSVQNSRRTIIILSKDFIQSIWFQVEFHTAYYQMLEDKIDRLIVIVRGELPPKDQMDKDLVFLLTTKTYLVWGEKWFWEKLRYALPHKSTRKRALASSLTDNSNSDNKSRYLKKSHFSTNAINYLKSNKDGSSKSKSPSKSAMMKEYVDQAIANHFQLNSTSNGSSLKSNVINGKSSFSLSSTTTTSTTASSTTPTSPSLQSNMPNYGSTSDPIDGNFSTIKTSNRVINNDKGDIGDYSKQGHVNESFVIETET